jgi:thiamine-monophosphate kinase
MKVRELGEFGLIELIADIVGKSSKHGLVLGIGDDAAAWHADKSIQIGTTDILVQDVHFNLSTITWRDLGWKALAVNLSDIAAMGGTPGYALVSLGLPPDTEVDDIVKLYRGMKAIAKKYDVEIVGGNISKAPVVIVDVSLIGKASKTLLTRSAASVGDQIAVTGYLGQSAAGLRMLKSGLKFDRKTTALLREAHLRPIPRVAEGQTLILQGVKAAIDLSDGLMSDLPHICKASQLGAKVWIHKLPIHPLMKSTFKDEALGLALSGGEDYELLFTAKSNVIQKLQNIMSIPVTAIGEIVSDHPGQVTLCDRQGKAVVKWDKRGWEHFKSLRRNKK